MKDISILLTTYNRPDDCIRCLTKLLSQKTDKVEIILLDDLHFHNEKLIDFCAQHDIKYIHTGSQKNGQPMWRVPGFALNIGAKHSCGEYLIIGNAEVFQMSENTVQLMYSTGIMAFPRGYDQPDKNSQLDDYKKWKRLGRLPFFMGVPRKAFFDIGGYDEDFIGYAWEDHDLVTRLDKVISSTEVNADIIHLWNRRGTNSRDYASNLNGTDLQLNKRLFYERRNNPIRNEGRDWGNYEYSSKKHKRPRS